MPYGICNLSIIPLKYEPSNRSGMLSQLLYGETFEILEQKQKWSRIRTSFDALEGWLDNNQFYPITEEIFRQLHSEEPVYSSDLLEFISDEKANLLPIPIGSQLNGIPDLNHHYEGNFVSGSKPKKELVGTAYLFLNAPFLWGGKSPLGIDASGLVQTVYKLNGYNLPREILSQSAQGEALSFIEESEPGDLAFFDNLDGEIDHVGIMMSDNYIIHAYGKVRIDRIDHSGIYNPDLGKHTHQLRVIKKIVY